jgi:hypothetical protein
MREARNEGGCHSLRLTTLIGPFDTVGWMGSFKCGGQDTFIGRVYHHNIPEGPVCETGFEKA